MRWFKIKAWAWLPDLRKYNGERHYSVHPGTVLPTCAPALEGIPRFTIISTVMNPVPDSGSYNRTFSSFHTQTYEVIGLMDGSHCLDQIWDVACEKLGDDMPSQDEVIRLLGQLHRADVIQPTCLRYCRITQATGLTGSDTTTGQAAFTLAIKIPLWDPNNFR